MSLLFVKMGHARDLLTFPQVMRYTEHLDGSAYPIRYKHEMTKVIKQNSCEMIGSWLIYGCMPAELFLWGKYEH